MSNILAVDEFKVVLCKVDILENVKLPTLTKFFTDK